MWIKYTLTQYTIYFTLYTWYTYNYYSYTLLYIVYIFVAIRFGCNLLDTISLIPICEFVPPLPDTICNSVDFTFSQFIAFNYTMVRPRVCMYIKSNARWPNTRQMHEINTQSHLYPPSHNNCCNNLVYIYVIYRFYTMFSKTRVCMTRPKTKQIEKT